MNKKIMVFLLIIPLFMRLFYLTADAPSDYQIGTHNGDEGSWMINARNKILFNEWLTEREAFNPIFISPLHSLVLYSFFFIFGQGIVIARLMSVFFSIFSILIFYKILKSINKKVAIIGIFLLSYNFVYLIFSRTAMLDIFAIFFLVLTFYFFAKYQNNPKFVILVGISSILAFIAKAVNIFLLPVIFFSILPFIYKKNYKNILKTYSYLFLGWLIMSLIFMFTFLIPFSGHVKSNLLDILSGTLNRSITILGPLFIFKIMTIGFSRPFFIRMPIISLSAFIYFILLVKRILERKNINPLNLFCMNWILLSFVLFFVTENITPMRRMVQLIIPMVFLSAQALSNLNSYFHSLKGNKIITILYFILVYNIIGNLFKYLFFRYSDFLIEETTTFFLKFNLPLFSSEAVTTFLSLIFSLFITIILFIIHHFKKIDITIDYKGISKSFLNLILIGVFLISIFQYYALVVKADDSYYRASIDLGKVISKERIQGRLSPRLTTENDNIPIMPIYEYTYKPNAEYFIISTNREYGLDLDRDKKLIEMYPNATLIWTFNLSDKEFPKVELYKRSSRDLKVEELIPSAHDVRINSYAPAKTNFPPGILPHTPDYQELHNSQLN